MKLIKFFSFVLALMMLGCTLMACDGGSSGGDEDYDLPEREFYSINVSFQIKDATGKTVIDAVDYNYKSHAEPTILNVLDTYLSVVEDWTCKIDKTNTITQIGGMKANKNNGEYWGFVTNTTTDASGNVSLKDMSAINLSMDQINKYKSDGKMSGTTLIDGAEFTVILFTAED